MSKNSVWLAGDGRRVLVDVDSNAHRHWLEVGYKDECQTKSDQIVIESIKEDLSVKVEEVDEDIKKVRKPRKQKESV